MFGKKIIKLLSVSSCLLCLACSVQAKEDLGEELAAGQPAPKPRQNPPKLLKVAFVGDSGYGSAYKKVLQLIKREHVDLVLHLGDLGYDEDNNQAPKKWDAMVTEVLGQNFPYIFIIGNHDRNHWHQKNPEGYGVFLRRRLEANKAIHCVGEEGIKAYCTYHGLFFVLSGIGTSGQGHEDFIRHALSQANDYNWRICAWHKNQRDMQAGTKPDEVGWLAYRLCQEQGAMIATGHEHSYARSRTLQELGNASKNHGASGDPRRVELDRGKTFVFVSGLGGHSLRPFDCQRQNSRKWWASVLTSNFYMENDLVKYDTCDEDDKALKILNAKPANSYGALFVTFHDQDDPRLAKGEFKTIDNTIMDAFVIRTKL